MRARRSQFIFACWSLLSLVAMADPSQTIAQSKEHPLPDFQVVQQFVLSKFQPSYDYQPGDLITRSQVQPVLSELATIGWKLERPELILERVLPDDDFLVKQMRTRKGKKLYDKVSNIPGAIDHLDRLRQLPHGETTFDVFVQKTPNSVDLMETLLTTKRGKRFAKDVAKFKSGESFNKPTGRIYRVQELLQALKEMYDWEFSKRAAQPRQ